MRLNNVTVQGTHAPLVMARGCVCVAAPAESSHKPQAEPTGACPTCGGSRPQASEASATERPEKRKLQDFLSAFV
jgi:hypothetical protein